MEQGGDGSLIASGGPGPVDHEMEIRSLVSS
jgi:hypothetical protein